MAHINEVLDASRHYGYGIPENFTIDYNYFKQSRDAVVKRLNGVYERNWSAENIDLVHGRANFVAPHTIEVELRDSTPRKARFTAPHILIATGGRPDVPEVPGAENGITSDGFFELEELPRKVAIVGAGYIAVELAGIMAALNVETHMFIRGNTFLRKFDPMIQETMASRYEAMGIVIHRAHLGCKEIQLVLNEKGKDKLLKVVGNDGSEVEVNELLWAIGRSPEVKDLQLQIAGVEQKSTGHIRVDQHQNTSAKGIYAIGDVTGQAELTPGADILLI